MVKKPCSEAGCDKPSRTRGRCKSHYSAWYYGPDGPGKDKNRDAVDMDKRRASWRAKNHRRRGTTRGGDFTAADEVAMRAKAKRCPLCKVKLIDEPYQPASKELDHILPRSMGGTHTHGNLRVICRTCNLTRPKDGSDYTGPLTLWSAEPGFVPKRDGRCSHGVVPSRRCYDCKPLAQPRRADDGRRAAELRAQGLPWSDIAAAVGLRPSNAGALARRYGDPATLAQWPTDDPLCLQCREPLVRSAGKGRPRKYCSRCRPPQVTQSSGQPRPVGLRAQQLMRLTA